MARDQRLNILVISNVSFGLYNFRSELLEKLCQTAFVFVIAEDNGRRDEIERLGVRFIEVKVNRRSLNPFQDLKLLLFYKRQIKRLKPDVVLTYTIKPNVYGGLVCAFFGVPYIANITGLGTALEKKGLLQRICLTLYKYGLRKAKRVFFQNQSNLDFMLKHKIVRDNYDLLPGSGVNLNRFIPSEYPSDEKIIFVFVGRIMKEKGVEQYFEAARRLRQKYPKTEFRVYGRFEENYRDVVEGLQRDGIVDYYGVSKDMPLVYRSAHCVVLPTYYPEGMSNVLLEACASARPIVTTDRPGCREILVDGFNGYQVKTRDSEDLIRTLERFINLPEEKKRILGLNARKYVEDRFDREIVVQKYLNETSDV